MSKKYAILSLLCSVILFISWMANPPDGHTGAPNEGLCSDCHSGGGGQDGSISVAGFPTMITPNTAYVLTVTNANPNGLANLAGFQLTILNSNNQQAGTITGWSAGSTVQSSGGRQYWEHNPAQPYPMSNQVMWTATWTSPSNPPNTTITYYVAGNIANGNGFSTGDLIDSDMGSGMLQGGGGSITVTITSTDVTCNGEDDGTATAFPSGGVAPYGYAWSNGGNTATINNLAPGTYTVTVTDAPGATGTASVSIAEPTELILNSPSINHVDCFGGNDGSITVSASGGTNPYIFNWSNGGSGTTISNLTAGSYTVTVTDDLGCTQTGTFVVNQPQAIVISLNNLDHESCDGESDGSISIQVSGGASPYFAEWSNSNIGFTISNLEPGDYDVTVTDNNNCTQTASYTINPGGTIDVSLIQIVHVTCNGGDDGSITLAASGGTGPYTYSWSNGDTGSSIDNLSAGTYLVTVSDAQSCDVVEGYTINQPGAISISISQSDVNACFGDTIADLTASATGGISPYTAVWSDGTTGLTNMNVGAGNYTITVTDQNDCTGTASVAVTSPPALLINVTTTNETSSGANDGTASVTVSGGTAPYTYLWSNDSTSQNIIDLAPGIYIVTITDAAGCTGTGSGQVNAFGCLLSVALGMDVSMCADSETLLDPSVTGATGMVTYVWSNGTTDSTLLVTGEGTYCVSVSDEAGCAANDCIVITEIFVPLLTCGVTNESAPGANDGAILCEENVMLTYLWSNGSTQFFIDSLTPGEYCLTLTDMNGCTNTQCFDVQSGNCNLVVTGTQQDVLCNGDTTGSVTLSVAGATDPVTFAWSNGNNTSVNSNLGAGVYVVTVTDGIGCTAIETFTIHEPPPLVITLDSVHHIEGGNPGGIFVSVAGNDPFSLEWMFPDGSVFNVNDDLVGLNMSGTYTLTVTDNNQCTASIEVVIDIIDATDEAPYFKPLKVYPVPANDYLVISHDQQIVDAVLMGVDGRIYQRYTLPADNKLDVSMLNPGWYLLRMTDGEHWFIARMIK